MDESHFLKEQSDDALAAMRTTLRDAKGDISRYVDPRGWARSHPWQAVAAAAASGFVAGDVLGRPPAQPRGDGPREPSHVGRFLIRMLKRAIRITAAIAQPLAQELWAAHLASVNGAPKPNSESSAASPPPADGPSDPSIQP